MPAEKKEKKEKSGDFNINDLASEMGVEAATARIALRKRGVKKTGRSYTWKSRSEIRDLAKKLKGKDEEVDDKPKKKKKEKEAA